MSESWFSNRSNGQNPLRVAVRVTGDDGALGRMNAKTKASINVAGTALHFQCKGHSSFGRWNKDVFIFFALRLGKV